MTLGELFAGIANAIRSKDGTTDRIPALTFPERILAISGGGGGGPFCTMSVMTGDNNIVAFAPVNIGVAAVSVSTEEYRDPASYTHALYNGVRLPRIPESVLNSYQHMFIRRNTTNGYYEMYCANGKPYYNPSKGWIEFSTSTARQRYRVAIASAETATAWENNGTSTANVNIDSARPVMWSNNGIPNGSASSINIYFEGTAPVLTD